MKKCNFCPFGFNTDQFQAIYGPYILAKWLWIPYLGNTLSVLGKSDKKTTPNRDGLPEDALFAHFALFGFPFLSLNGHSF